MAGTGGGGGGGHAEKYLVCSCGLGELLGLGFRVWRYGWPEHWDASQRCHWPDGASASDLVARKPITQNPTK